MMKEEENAKLRDFVDVDKLRSILGQQLAVGIKEFFGAKEQNVEDARITALVEWSKEVFCRWDGAR